MATACGPTSYVSLPQWTSRGSNPVPSACKADALPNELEALVVQADGQGLEPCEAFTRTHFPGVLLTSSDTIHMVVQDFPRVLPAPLSLLCGRACYGLHYRPSSPTRTRTSTTWLTARRDANFTMGNRCPGSFPGLDTYGGYRHRHL